MLVVGGSTVAAFLLLVSEITFYLLFHLYLLSWVNKKKLPQKYRGYGRDRHKLFVRILKRLYRTFEYEIGLSKLDGINYEIDSYIKHHTIDRHKKFASVINAFFRNFFCDDKHTLRLTSQYNTSGPDHNQLLKKGDFDKFLAWAFFEKSVEELQLWEFDEIEKMNQYLYKNHGFSFKPGHTQNIVPCRLSIDPVLATYKPLLVYVILIAVKLIGMIILFVCGFRLYTTSTNIRYWFRPTTKTYLSKKNKSNMDKYPFLFFHGISPGGYTMYLPFLLCGILDYDRPIFLFETSPITCTLQFPSFYSSSEDETIIAVTEVINYHLGECTKVILCGHSFGTCQITWLIHAIPHRIHQVILIDPVTILLSNADVMVNFLYRSVCHSKYTTSLTTTSKFEIKQKRPRQAQAQRIVSSEVGIEYYLRKHFSWYNSELWLEDIPNNVQVMIFLSGRDDIINACDVKKEIKINIQTRQKTIRMSYERNENDCKHPNLKLVYWPMDGHGDCILSPKRWSEIKQQITIK